MTLDERAGLFPTDVDDNDNDMIALNPVIGRENAGETFADMIEARKLDPAKLDLHFNYQALSTMAVRGAAAIADGRFTPEPVRSLASLRSLIAASTFDATSASVSPKAVRRSEWPRMTRPAPASASISAEIDPVKAPDGLAWQS